MGGRAFDVLAPDLVAYMTPLEEVRVAARGATWVALDAGGTDIHDGLLSSDVRVLGALPPTSTAAGQVGPARRLLVLRGREIQQISCTP